MERLKRIVSNFSQVTVLVIGDLMLDKYIWGEVKRISPEAPVQIVNVRKETLAPGGAANVAANVGSLGSKTLLMGIMGNDQAKKALIKIVTKHGVATKGVITDRKKPTTQKVRVIGQNQQLLRIDYENSEYLNKQDEKKAINYAKKMMSKVQAIIISDYAKGLITQTLITEIEKSAKDKGVPVIIDPKPIHTITYKNATLITPNSIEAYQMTGMKQTDTADIVEVGRKLTKMTQSNVLITRGARGMALFKLDDTVVQIPTMAKEVYDVTGAGDSVVAALALSLAAGASLEDAATIANHAAGITVGKIGTSTVKRSELLRGLDMY